MQRLIKFLLLLFCLLLLSSLLTVQAAGENWRVWLHEVGGRQLTMVNDAGEVLQTLSLPLPDLSYSTVSRNVGISHDGNKIAYFLTNGAGNIVFELYDVAAMTMYSGIYTPPSTTYGRTSLDIVGGSRVFSQGDQYLAIAVQSFDTSYWEIVVIDTTTRRVTNLLSSSDALVTGYLRDGYGLPVIQEVTSDSVHFNYLEGMEGMARYRSLVWNFAASTLNETRLYPQMDGDFFAPTGEFIVPAEDEAYPNRIPFLEGIPIQMNVLQVNRGGTSFVWIAEETTSFYGTRFVENGRRILVQGADVATNIRFWRLYERDWNFIAGSNPIWEMNGLEGVGDGFIYIATNVVASGEPALIHHDTTGDRLDVFSTVWIGAAGTYPQIAWLNDVRFGSSTDFAAWASFPVPPTLGEPPLPSPTPALGVPLALAVGTRARIVTTEGDMLNGRSGAGTAFAVLFQFANNTGVTLLEGPISAGGFQWWRVRADDGREAWVVDFADGLATLVRE